MTIASSISARLMRKSARPMLFAAVGALAFGVDMGVLALAMHGLGLAPALARGFSILLATSVAWYANRRLTFAPRRRARPFGEWLRYLAVNALGMTLNYGIYVAIVSLTRYGATHPLASVIPGGLIALAVNYCLAARLVFTAARDESAADTNVSSHR